MESLYFNFNTNLSRAKGDTFFPSLESLIFKRGDQYICISCGGKEHSKLSYGVMAGRWRGLEYHILDSKYHIISEQKQSSLELLELLQKSVPVAFSIDQMYFQERAREISVCKDIEIYVISPLLHGVALYYEADELLTEKQLMEQLKKPYCSKTISEFENVLGIRMDQLKSYPDTSYDWDQQHIYCFVSHKDVMYDPAPFKIRKDPFFHEYAQLEYLYMDVRDYVEAVLRGHPDYYYAIPDPEKNGGYGIVDILDGDKTVICTIYLEREKVLTRGHGDHPFSMDMKEKDEEDFEKE